MVKDEPDFLTSAWSRSMCAKFHSYLHFDTQYKCPQPDSAFAGGRDTP